MNKVPSYSEAGLFYEAFQRDLDESFSTSERNKYEITKAVIYDPIYSTIINELNLMNDWILIPPDEIYEKLQVPSLPELIYNVKKISEWNLCDLELRKFIESLRKLLYF